MKIVWTHEARVHLQEIAEFISKDSPPRAQEFIGQVVERAKVLSDNPRIGRIVPEISDPDTRELIFKNYRVVHRLSSRAVHILTIFEGHRLLRDEEINK